MPSIINKKTLEYLAELSRIDIGDKGQATSNKEEKLLKDLQKILEYFEELKEVDTENIEPTRLPSPEGEALGGQVAGGTIEKNVFRSDEEGLAPGNAEGLTGQFPEKENGFLKIPPVFE